MTRVSGIHIIKASCCGALMRTPAYASINFRASEYWTDGSATDSLAPGGEGLRRCLCGQCFLLSAADYVRVIWSPKKPAPPGWEDQKDNAWTRFMGRETREQILERYDTRSAAEIDAEQRSIPPSPLHIKDSELLALIKAGLPDLEVQTVVRRLYWRYLNTPDREVYRQFRQAHPDVDASGNSFTFPDFNPTPEQTENMRQLIELGRTSSCPGWLEIAELYRQLGDLGAATLALSRSTEDVSRLRTVIEKVIVLKAHGPVRFQ